MPSCTDIFVTVLQRALWLLIGWLLLGLVAVSAFAAEPPKPAPEPPALRFVLEEAKTWQQEYRERKGQRTDPACTWLTANGERVFSSRCAFERGR